MLRISTIDSPHECHLVVEGKLVAPWVAELKTACQAAKEELKGRELVVDLHCLMLISQEGENILFDLMTEGAQLRGRGVFAKYIIGEMARRAGAKNQASTS